jgi:N6-adenosine-specific RNA methylase IME4
LSDLRTDKEFQSLIPPLTEDEFERLEKSILTEGCRDSLTIDQICQVPVKDIFTDDAILFLWSTSPMLKKALTVLDAWGFEYRTNMV